MLEVFGLIFACPAGHTQRQSGSEAMPSCLADAPIYGAEGK